MKKIICLAGFLWFGISFLSLARLVSQEHKSEPAAGKSDISAIEKGLYEALNLERTSRSLPPLASYERRCKHGVGICCLEFSLII
jgi:hypothetical protein